MKFQHDNSIDYNTLFSLKTYIRTDNMSSIKPITFYNHASGPNPRKVALIFAELNIPHEIVSSHRRPLSFYSYY